ncbi:MAG: NAD-dependent epimerase/dehydratase family protein [Candidatus Dormiibacterota bacterium]
MPRALILGGRGQSGRAIGHRLSTAGWEVIATTAGALPVPPTEPEISWVALARDSATDLRNLIPSGADLVVDVTAYTVAHAEQLLCLGDTVGAAIVFSTLAVYSDTQGRSMETATDEDSFPAWPVPIPEDWPTLSPGEDSYATRKAAVERVLRQKAPWPLTVVRPGAIHGPHSHHLREWYLIKRVLDGRRQVVLPYQGASIFQSTATINLAELVALAADHPGNRTLNCADRNPPSVIQISEIVDELMGSTTERVLVTGLEPAPTVGNHPWAVPRPVVADMSLAASELGYREMVSYPEALATTLPWAIDATAGRDWREIFPTLASYPADLFDYPAEDAYLSSGRTSDRNT